jgi:peptide deformylase
MKKTSKNYKLVTDIIKLKTPSAELCKTNFETEDEYKSILSSTINTCIAALSDNTAHYCAAANQIGVLYKVGIVNITEPIILINPVLIVNDETKKVPYLECNISLQSKLFITHRFVDITVIADNLASPLVLKYDGILDQVENTDLYNDPILMEIVFIQQVIDSMNGILPMDRLFVPKRTPITVDEKIARNSFITIQKENKKINVKFKKLDNFLKNGWIVIPFEELTTHE